MPHATRLPFLGTPPKNGWITIQPGLFCPQLGDISLPLLVWRAGIKVLSQQSAGHRQIMPTMSGGLEFSGSLAPESGDN